MIDLAPLGAAELLKLHARVSDELRVRGITRSSNNPTGDLAEFLFCRAFGWSQAGNSNPNVDAVSPDGVRYQIKGRRITPQNGSRQMSAIRDLQGSNFDFLAAVLFDQDYSILRAAIISIEVVVARATFVPRTNSHKFFLRDDVVNMTGVRDVTDGLRAVSY